MLGTWAAALALVASACAGTGFDPAASANTAPTPLPFVAEDGSLIPVEAPTAAVAGGTGAALGSPGSDRVTVGSLPIGLAAGHGLIWVTNSGDDTVALIEPESRAVVANIFTGAITGPRAIAVGDQWAVVANTGAKSVSMIDVIRREPGPTVSVGEDPVDVIVVAGEAWVANALGNSVSVVDLATRSVETIPVGMRPEGLAFGDGRIFVTNLLANAVTVIDRESRGGLASIPVGAGPIETLFHNGQIFVTNGQDGTVSVISAATLTVTETIAIFGEPSAMAVGDDGLVWVIQRVGGQVKAIDPITLEVVREESLGSNSGGIAAINGEIWVTNSDDASISIIDAAGPA